MSEQAKPSRRSIAVALVPALSPWLGVAARVASADPWHITFIGITLWILSLGAIWHLYQSPEIAGKRSLVDSVVLSTLTFVPTFTGTALATGVIIRRWF